MLAHLSCARHRDKPITSDGNQSFLFLSPFRLSATDELIDASFLSMSANERQREDTKFDHVFEIISLSTGSKSDQYSCSTYNRIKTSSIR